MRDNILTVDQIEELTKTLNKKRTVLVGGAFDILHLGHITFLENSKNIGDVLIVLLESDQKIKKIKGSDRPINPQNERARIISSLKTVDYVIKLPFFKSDKEYDQLIQRIHPTIIAATEGDMHIHHKKRQAKLMGVNLKIVTPKIPYRSTSRLITASSKPRTFRAGMKAK